MSTRQLWWGCVLLLAAGTLVLALWPGIDQAVSARFYDPNGAGETRFYLNRGFPVGWIYDGVQLGSRVLGLALLVLLVLSLVPTLDRLRARRRAVGFLLLALLLGPGLVVHTLKDEWPRPRPRDTQLFQGVYEFHRLGVPSGACRQRVSGQPRCRSFPSGHAGFGAYLGAPAFVDRRRRYGWLLLGAGGALGVGFARIVVGGHWLSDVLSSYWIVTGAMALTWWLFFGDGHRRIRQLFAAGSG
jgi:lipid A 4'-phosphatase